jgi:hypothetical protein
MPATFTVNGSNTTISFTFTMTTTKTQSIVGIVSLYLWNRGYGNHGTPQAPILYSSLTNQQQLDLIFQHVKTSIMNVINIDAYQKSATDAQANVDTNLTLPN